MDALGINIPSLLWQVVAFLLLMGLLWKFAMEPITRLLDERQRRIEESVKNAERIKQDMIAGEQRQRVEMDKARQEAQDLLTQAKQMADKLVSDARNQARDEQVRLTAKAQAEIEEEKRRALTELRTEVGNIAILAAGKIIAQSLDTKGHYQIIDNVLANSTLFAGSATSGSNGGGTN